MAKSKDPLADQAFTSEREALRASSILGCSGAHQTSDGWMPCASEEALTALVDGGVEAYRALSEKGLVRRSVRKIRHVRLDPNARDADGDGLLQEGTTAERPAKPSKRGVAKVRTALPSIKKPTPMPTRKPTVKPTLPQRKVEVRSTVADMRKRKRIEAKMKHLDDEIRKLGGLGRPRTKEEGPLPEARGRGDEIRRQIEADFGDLKTLQDYESALNQVFPNAEIDFGKMFRDITEANERTIIQQDAPSGNLPKNDPLDAWGSPHDDLQPGLQGFFDAVLFKGSNDKQTAKLVGAIQLVEPDVNVMAQVSYSVGSPLKHPIAIQFNPRRISRSALHDDNTLEIAALKYIADLADRDYIKKTGQGHWSNTTSSIVDSDAELEGMWTGFHEWAHAKGIALTHAETSPEFTKEVQKWVKSGGKPAWLPDYPKLTQADHIGTRTATLVNNPDPLMKTHMSDVQVWFRNMGFGSVDMSDPAQVAGAYRAIAVRNMMGRQLFERLHERTARMKKGSWGGIDRVSGYGNTEPEEGIAEFLAFAEVTPELAVKMMPRGFRLPEVQERLS